MWITGAEYRKKYNITYQQFYQLKKSNKLKIKPYVGKQVLVWDENVTNDNDSSENKMNVIYLRVDTENDKTLLKTQEESIKNYMFSNGMTCNKIYKDISYSFDERIELKNMIYDAFCNKINTVVVYDENSLCSFNFNLVKFFLSCFSVKIIVINSYSEDEQCMLNLNDYNNFIKQKVENVKNTNVKISDIIEKLTNLF